MRKGFTLTEILTTIVILAVLAAIAIPNFRKTREKAALNQAVAYLRVIRTGQKMYYAKWGEYNTGRTTPDAIRAHIGAEITESQGYNIDVPDVAGTNDQTFTATATKTGSDTIAIDQDGNFTKGGAAWTPPN